MSYLRDALIRLSRREDLPPELMRQIFTDITAGKLSDINIAAFLMGLAVKGITPDELAAAASVMRQRVIRIPISVDAIDNCGTGGDGISTFNVSTSSAIVAAAAGAYVAKHGNRTNTRRSGSAEFLSALGVNIEADVDTVKECIEKVGIGFCYAIKLHPAMKYVAAVRKELRIRTIFNLLGPLTNPAGVSRQIIGVPNEELLGLIANTLKILGTKRAMVVHGEDGLCDITITGPSIVAELKDGDISYYKLNPEDFGLPRGRLEEITIGSPEESAELARRVFNKEKGTARDIVLLNAAAALVVAEKASDIKEGIELAREAIDKGKAKETLDRLIELSNR